MRQCNWCDRWFRNKQAVRGHLRCCKEWKVEKKRSHRRKYEHVKVYKCGTCWSGPIPGGYAATQADIDAVSGHCPTCQVPGRWIVVGNRTFPVDRSDG